MKQWWMHPDRFDFESVLWIYQKIQSNIPKWNSWIFHFFTPLDILFAFFVGQLTVAELPLCAWRQICAYAARDCSFSTEILVLR